MVPPFVSLLPLAAAFASLAAMGPVRIRALRRRAARARMAYEAPVVVYDPEPRDAPSIPDGQPAASPMPRTADGVLR
jgi:hypothetical protein